jgi:hypothetical protein
MSDISIVDRLLHCSENCGDEYLRELTGKAADTITRLTTENEKLKAAIEAAIVDLTNNQRLQAHRKLARALSGDKHE